MEVNDRVKKVVYAAIDEVNLLLPEEQRLEHDPSTPLVGENGRLDSLGVVNLIVTTEQKVQAEFKSVVSLTEMMSAENLSHYQTVGALCEHLTKQLGESSNGA